MLVEDPRAWVRIAESLRSQIGSGRLPDGAKAPSITTLAQEHGVARQTASKALRALEDDGLLTRVPGLGYFVAGQGHT